MLSAGHKSRSFVFLATGTCRPTQWHYWAIGFGSGHCCNAQPMAKKKNPAAIELGRRGGRASARKLTDEQRKEKARKAAQARWAKKRAKRAE